VKNVQTNATGVVHACFDVDAKRAVALCGAYIVDGRTVPGNVRVTCPACARRLRAGDRAAQVTANRRRAAGHGGAK
jgi:hypothetical protein